MSDALKAVSDRIDQLTAAFDAARAFLTEALAAPPPEGECS